MKKLLILTAGLFAYAAHAIEGAPTYKMTEQDLLAVVKNGSLDDRVTACQELMHRGGAASVPVLGAFLTDICDPALFHAALYGLQNIPDKSVDSMLSIALARTKGKRQAAIAQVQAFRKNPALDGYAGADAAITAFPPPTPARKGDLAAVPALIDAATAGGHAATLARRQLVGFPNAALDTQLIALAQGADVKKARLALGVLGERRARVALDAIVKLAEKGTDNRVRTEAYKALGQLCAAPQDLPLLISMLTRNPNESRLEGALVRVAARAFKLDTRPVTVVEAKFGNFRNGRVADVVPMLDGLLMAGSREIMAGCRLVGRGGFPGDPAPGQPKELRVAYRIANGPIQRAVVPDNTQMTFGETTLDPAVARPLVAAAQTKGPAQAAFVRVLDALARRGTLPEAALFRPLGTGRDLAGWSQDGDFFRVENGVIIGESTAAKPCTKSRYLVYSAEEFSDFEVRCSFRLSGAANSGLQFRGGKDTLVDTGYQADMDGAGGIVGYLYCTGQHLVGPRGADVAITSSGRKSVTRFAADKDMQSVYRKGDWNDLRVVVKGRTILTWVNGVRTAGVLDDQAKFLADKGYFAIQLHQGAAMKVEFRDLRVCTVAVSTGADGDRLIAQYDALQLEDAPSFVGADWIWYPNNQHPNTKATFRAKLELPAGEIERAGFIFSCDDAAIVTVNGKEVAEQIGEKLWYTPTAVLDLKRLNLKAGGVNLIEVAAENRESGAGFLAVIEIAYKDGRIVRFPTSPRGWEVSLDGESFCAPQAMFPYGVPPYGTFPRKF